jgi:signal transduction histidine kinase
MSKEKARLLIVEDSANERFLIRLVFKSNWEILEAENGEIGLDLARQSLPDVILLDVDMPVMNGITMLQKLRADARTKDLLVIILTGNATNINNIEEGFSSGADDYLFKPFNIDELNLRVSNMLKRRCAEKALQQLQADFVAMLIHDLKSPLTAIGGFNDLLLQRRIGEINERQERCVKISQEACHSMLKIINAALDLSKFEAGKFILNKSWVNLSDLLKDCLERMRVMAEAHQIEFLLELSDNLPPIEADREKLDQVLTNLLSNAIKFTPAGGSVRLKSKQADKAIEVAVIDSGVGIPIDEQSLLFQKYSQGTSGRQAKGTGLGLAICRSIIDAHNGSIWVESHPQAGSSFIFSLPIYQPVI